MQIFCKIMQKEMEMKIFLKIAFSFIYIIGEKKSKSIICSGN